MKRIGILIIVMLCWSAPTWACGTCYGDPNSTQTQGLNMAILFLLGVVGTQLCGIMSFIFYLAVRAHRGRNLA